MKTRTALIAAGLKLFADRTVGEVSVDSITQHAGVAKGSFFNHFGDKREFASVVAKEICRDIEARIRLANLEVTDPALRVARGIFCLVEFAFNQRHAARNFARINIMNADAALAVNAGVRADVTLGVRKKRFKLTSAEAGTICVTGTALRLLASIVAKEPKFDQAVSVSVDATTVLLTGMGIESNEARCLSRTAAISLIAE